FDVPAQDAPVAAKQAIWLRNPTLLPEYLGPLLDAYASDEELHAASLEMVWQVEGDAGAQPGTWSPGGAAAAEGVTTVGITGRDIVSLTKMRRSYPIVRQIIKAFGETEELYGQIMPLCRLGFRNALEASGKRVYPEMIGTLSSDLIMTLHQNHFEHLSGHTGEEMHTLIWNMDACKGGGGLLDISRIHELNAKCFDHLEPDSPTYIDAAIVVLDPYTQNMFASTILHCLEELAPHILNGLDGLRQVHRHASDFRLLGLPLQAADYPPAAGPGKAFSDRRMEHESRRVRSAGEKHDGGPGAQDAAHLRLLVPEILLGWDGEDDTAGSGASEKNAGEAERRARAGRRRGAAGERALRPDERARHSPEGVRALRSFPGCGGGRAGGAPGSEAASRTGRSAAVVPPPLRSRVAVPGKCPAPAGPAAPPPVGRGPDLPARVRRRRPPRRGLERRFREPPARPPRSRGPRRRRAPDARERREARRGGRGPRGREGQAHRRRRRARLGRKRGAA
ncbi:MAG: hypothetical protein BJ554DRAFT_2925, partial [Olpidium bornovanus]